MISSLTDVANFALNIINGGSIVSIDGSDKPSMICKRYIDPAFDEVLSLGEFSACRKRSLLTLSTATPLPNHKYAFELPVRSPQPDGYIKALSLQSKIRFEMEGGILSTDDPTPILVYVYRPQNLAKYQPFCLEAVAAKLATMICMEIVPDANRVSLANQSYTMFFQRARAHSLSEQKGTPKQTARWNDFNDGVSALDRA